MHRKNKGYLGTRKPHKFLHLFKYGHLPAGDLREASRPFFEMAQKLDYFIWDNNQKDKMFEWLLLAKDCAVRAMVWTDNPDLPGDDSRVLPPGKSRNTPEGD